MERATIEDAQSVEGNGHRFLDRALLALVVLVVLEGLLFLGFCHVLLGLGESLVLEGFLLDVLLSDLDESVFETVELYIDLEVGHVLLNLGNQIADLVNKIDRDQVEVLLVGRVRGLQNSFKAFSVEEDSVNGLKILSKLLLGQVGRGTLLNVQVISHAKATLDIAWVAKCDDFTVRHDAHTISQLVGLLNVLGAHDDGSTSLQAHN